MMQDSIDFGTMNIPKLFRMMFIPTLLGMILSATINIADGIFVGRGVGNDALAAVNIVAPFFMLATGIGLMFGVGASIVASIHLSHQKVKVANINITQALSISLCIMLSLSLLVMTFRAEVALLLGSSEQLLPSVLEYMNWIVPFLAFYMLLNIGLFIIRLDGSPTYAMLCSAIPALINLTLDYIFVFPLHWGLMGAALASAISVIVGSIMIVVYIVGFSKVLHLYRPKFSLKSILLTIRNIGYMVKLGSSAFLTEAAIACMMLVGNYIFMRYLGEDGVAAYSVACYCFPIVFMVNNAIAQSTQPIISYNYGALRPARVKKAGITMALMALVYTGLMWSVIILAPEYLISVFSSDTALSADAVPALKLYFAAFIFMDLQYIGQTVFKSLNKRKQAIFFSLLRKVFIVVPLTYLLPYTFHMGTDGVFLAEPVSNVIGGSLCFITMLFTVLPELNRMENQ